MSYNIHPIFVHFPIAMLFVYSLIKIIPFQKWFPKVSWKQIELVLLVIGVLGACAALYTGGVAEDLVHPNHQLTEMHSTFAGLSTGLYGALLFGELLVFLTPAIIPKLKIKKLTVTLIWIQKLLTQKIVSEILALLGFIAITITGLLGGAIVYGATADPIAGFVLKLLGITL